MAVTLLNNTKDSSQPQTGSLADLLCGKKWFKDMPLDLLGHAGAGITYT